ncbi:hypothetical protein [Maribacter sp. HTCC2170]|uniref:hypothetical protein n=1 Tax=Maribacter sp. (strain HTCC2170 / KCCM 42371) TaxID=313603 RepID=UPI00006BE08B|nr:hypothetical protein [Maribacter sp. HTCC2170]EAR00044.1 hypothetical protein FB2170_01682 [Maribacter sp. HTCC2170]
MIKPKKSLFRLIVLSLFVFSLNSCAEKVEKEQEDAPEVLAPKQIVQIDQAKKMYDNYTDRRMPLIQNYEDSINGGKKKFDVARYVSYDYETIKQYLAFIEQEAKRANVEISGLRFYFSNYPDSPKFENGEPILHPRQNSVMLSPTLKGKDREYLFYIGGTEADQQAVLLSDSFGPIDTNGVGSIDNDNTKSHASFLPNMPESTTNTTLNASFYAGTSLTMNKGGGAPPPYN